MLAVAAVAAAGCGGARHASSTTSAGTTSPVATTPGTTTAGAAGLRAEAASAATGDIPDNQVFVVFVDPAARYAMRYPEGWAQSGHADRVVIRDKNNIVRIVVRKGTASVASALQELHSLSGVTVVHAPQSQTLPGGQAVKAVKAVYSTRSAPNPVTGKRVTLQVDRYYLRHGGRVAIVDLGTPVGVDNVDAYRLMIESFRWR